MGMKRGLFAVFAVFSSFTFYGMLLEFRFERNSWWVSESCGFSEVHLENGQIWGNEGEPELPRVFYNIICPQNKLSRISYSATPETTIHGVKLKPIVPSAPDMDFYQTSPKTEINPDIDSFPSELVSVIADGGLAGVHIVTLAVSPFVYFPHESKIVVFSRFEVELDFDCQKPDFIQPLVLTDAGKTHYIELLKKIVYNKEDINLYAPDYKTKKNAKLEFARSSMPPLPGDAELDFVIITPDSFVEPFQQLVDFELYSGFRGKVVATSQIQSHYTGFDLPEKIRLFLKDAYTYWGIWCVILGGDYFNVPLRFASAFDQVGRIESLPTPFYYLALDGTFNSDRDAFFGEENSDDAYPELIGGVLPVRSQAQISPLCAKMERYTNALEQNYISRWVFAASSLTADTGEFTGQTAKETILSRYSLPSSLELLRLYAYSSRTGGDEELNRASFLNAINNGCMFINHIDHATTSVIGAGYRVSGEVISISDIDALRNSPRLPFLFTFSCHTTDPRYDNISKHWVLNPQGGGIAFIGTSGAVWTPQIYADAYIVESILEGNHLIGEVFNYYLLRIVPDRYLAYAFYLDGNPLLNFYLPPGPDSLRAIIPDSIPNDARSIELVYQNSFGEPQEGVRVAVRDTEGRTCVALTNRLGQVSIGISAPITGYIYAFASGSNWFPKKDSIRVYMSDLPRFAFTRVSAHRQEGAGYVESGIQGALDFVVKNFGGSSDACFVLARSISENITMVDSSETLDIIAPGDSISTTSAISFSTSFFSGTREGAIELTLHNHTYSAFVDTVRFLIYGPKISVRGVSYFDTLLGDGDGVPDPLETGEIVVRVLNEGPGSFRAGLFNLLAYDPELQMVVDSVLLDNLRPMDSVAVVFRARMARVILRDGLLFKLRILSSGEEIQNINVKLGRPSPPASLSWYGGERSVTLVWQPPELSDPFLLGYNVYRANADSSHFSLITDAPITLATTFVDSALPERTIFYYYVTSVDSSFNESQPSEVIRGWTTLPSHFGFPVRLPSGTNIFASAAVGDVNHDGKLEIFVPAKNGKIFAFNEDGSDFVDINLSIPDPIFSVEDAEFRATPILADFLGNGEYELFVATRRSPVNRAYLLYPDGRLCEGWPRELAGPVIAPACAYDLDGDGRLEIILCTENKLIYIFRADGTSFDPSSSDGLFKVLDDSLDTGGASFSAPAVADIDCDGRAEIIVAGGTNTLNGNGILYAFDSSGELKTGFPLYVSGWINSGIALGNLDTNTSTLEIAFATTANLVYAVSGNGAIMPGFPVFIVFDYSDAYQLGGPALADINGDGICEIVIGGITRFVVYNASGRILPGWPVQSPGNASISEPAVADIDGDTIPELIFVCSSDFSISAYRTDGHPVPGFPLKVSGWLRATPTIAKFSTTNELSILATTYDENLYLWDLRAPETPNSLLWHTERGNYHRTGTRSASSTNIFEHNKLTQNSTITVVPNPFNSSLRISFELPHKYSVAQIYIVNLRGERVANFNVGSSGPHTINWAPEDLPSGLYFVILESGGKRTSTRAVFLK